jgi:hypothetical protein
MSKNTSRKGLAFGAGLALVVSGVSALPAQAAGAITLSPTTGSAYNTLTTSTFSLSPVITGVNADEYQYLRYLVTNSDEQVIGFNMTQGGNGDGELFYASGSTDDARIVDVSSLAFEDDGTDGTDELEGSDVYQITLPGPASNYFADGDTVTVAGMATASANVAITIDSRADVVANGTNATGFLLDNTLVYILAPATPGDQADTADVGTATLTLSATNARTALDSFVVTPDDVATPGNNAAALGASNALILDPQDNQNEQSYTVQAWIDGNQNNTIDTGELASAVQTVTFKEIGKLSAVGTLSGVTVGSTSVVMSVTLSGDINYQQVNSTAVIVDLLEDGVQVTPVDTGQLTWDSVNSRWRNVNTLGALTAGQEMTLNVYGDNDFGNTGSAQINAGDLKNTSTADTSAAVTNPTVDFRVTDTANAVTTLPMQSDPIGTDAAAYVTTQDGTASVRTGTASVELLMFVGTDVALPVAISDAEVSVAVTSTNVTNTDAITVAGKGLVSGATTVTAKTNATGNVSMTVTLGAADDGDILVFTPTINGAAVGETLTLTVTDGTYSVTQLTPGSLTIQAGAALEIAYAVVDEFGVAPVNGTHNVVVTPTANERTKAATFARTISVVDGKASLSVTDDGTGTGKFTASAKLALNGSITAIGSTISTVVNVVADSAPAKIVAEKLAYGTAQALDLNADGDYADTVGGVVETNNTAALLLENRDFANYDSRYNLPTVAAPTVRDSYKVTVGGKATNAAGSAVSGALVTFAAKGFLFSDGTVFAMDSITVRAGSTGIASVDVWSSVGGAQSITMTSGAATASQALVYAVGTGTATSFTLTAPASSEPGKTVDVKVTATDKFGNPAKSVPVTLYSTGPGYLINTTGTTLSDGTFSTKLLLGTNDSGSAVIAAVVTIDGVETIKTTTIAVGTRVTDASALPAGAVVNVGTFNGKIVVYAKGMKGSTITWKIAGKWEKAEVTMDFQRFDRPTVALGLDVMVDIHLAGNKTPVFSTTVTTK